MESSVSYNDVEDGSISNQSKDVHGAEGNSNPHMLVLHPRDSKQNKRGRVEGSVIGDQGREHHDAENRISS